MLSPAKGSWHQLLVYSHLDTPITYIGKGEVSCLETESDNICGLPSGPVTPVHLQISQTKCRAPHAAAAVSGMVIYCDMHDAQVLCTVLTWRREEKKREEIVSDLHPEYAVWGWQELCVLSSNSAWRWQHEIWVGGNKNNSARLGPPHTLLTDLIDLY